MRKAGNRVRISVQLVNVADGYHIWSETYDRTLDDIFAVQDDIAQSVVKELRRTLLGEDADSDASREVKAEVAAAAQGRGENTEVHRLYLQGKYLIDRLTKEDTEKGVAYLRQVLELDPNHALAWIRLSQAHCGQVGWGWDDKQETVDAARMAAQRAIELAPDLAEAHVQMALVRRLLDWDWKAAELSARRALELAPNSAEALREAGVLMDQTGRLEEGLELLQRATEQDPLSSFTYGQLAYLYRALGRMPEALAAYEKAAELSPNRVAAWHMMAITLSEMGRDEEALKVVERELAEWSKPHFVCRHSPACRPPAKNRIDASTS